VGGEFLMRIRWFLPTNDPESGKPYSGCILQRYFKKWKGENGKMTGAIMYWELVRIQNGKSVSRKGKVSTTFGDVFWGYEYSSKGSLRITGKAAFLKGYTFDPSKEFNDAIPDAGGADSYSSEDLPTSAAKPWFLAENHEQDLDHWLWVPDLAHPVVKGFPDK